MRHMFDSKPRSVAGTVDEKCTQPSPLRAFPMDGQCSLRRWPAVEEMDIERDGPLSDDMRRMGEMLEWPEVLGFTCKIIEFQRTSDSARCAAVSSRLREYMEMELSSSWLQPCWHGS